jgi:hypothetical protein
MKFSRLLAQSFIALASILGLGSTVGLGGAALTGCAAQVGDESSANPGGDVAGETVGQTEDELVVDAAFKRDVQRTAKGLLYTSETDAPYTYVSAKLQAGESVNEAAVRRAFAKIVDNDAQADRPLATLNGEVRSFASFRARFRNCSADQATECAKTEALNAVLEKNLTGIKVYYFGKNGSPGHVDGIGVSIFIVGKTKSGQLAGVRTFAVWT